LFFWLTEITATIKEANAIMSDNPFEIEIKYLPPFEEIRTSVPSRVRVLLYHNHTNKYSLSVRREMGKRTMPCRAPLRVW